MVPEDERTALVLREPGTNMIISFTSTARGSSTGIVKIHYVSIEASLTPMHRAFLMSDHKIATTVQSASR